MVLGPGALSACAACIAKASTVDLTSSHQGAYKGELSFIRSPLDAPCFHCSSEEPPLQLSRLIRPPFKINDHLGFPALVFHLHLPSQHIQDTASILSEHVHAQSDLLAIG